MKKIDLAKLMFILLMLSLAMMYLGVAAGRNTVAVFLLFGPLLIFIPVFSTIGVFACAHNILKLRRSSSGNNFLLGVHLIFLLLSGYFLRETYMHGFSLS